jgi:hypothetical protein
MTDDETNDDELTGARVRALLREVARDDPLPIDFARLRASTLPPRQPAGRRILRFALPMAGLATVVVAVLVVGALTSPSRHSEVITPGASGVSPSDAGTVVTTHAGLIFTRPANWIVVDPLAAAAPGPVFYLTDGVPLTQCPPKGMCIPVGALPANGVVITFVRGATLVPSDKEEQPVQRVDVSAYCQGVGADEVLTARRLAVGVIACLRGPDLASAERALDGLLASMRIGS